MYNILVADDSALMRKVMCDIINSVQNFQVSDVCGDGNTAARKLRESKFDACTINMSLPRMSGEDLIKQMKQNGDKTPVIALSSGIRMDPGQASIAFGNGAVDFVFRPFRMSPQQRNDFEDILIKSLHFAVGDGKERSKTYKASVSRPAGSAAARPRRGGTIDTAKTADIVSQRTRAIRASTSNSTAHSKPRASAVKLAPSSGYSGRYSLVAIASSTGGPQALNTLLPMFPGNIGVPMVIVQHMPKGFTASLAERIDAQSQLHVKEAEDGEQLKPNWVYIAPGGRHLEIVESHGGKLACKVYDAPPVNNLRPCADVMYRSLKKVSADHIICAVLTGMGADGSQGIKALKQNKDLYVITQSEDTCVVYGMPKAADESGLSNESQPITEISKSITKKLGV